MLKKPSLLIVLLLALAPLAHSDCATLDITDEYLGSGAFYVNTPADVQVHGYGGTPPYTFSTYAGALPPGLSMDSSGHITGTPTTAGNYFWCVTITDSLGCHITKCFSIDVY